MGSLNFVLKFAFIVLEIEPIPAKKVCKSMLAKGRSMNNENQQSKLQHCYSTVVPLKKKKNRINT